MFSESYDFDKQLEAFTSMLNSISFPSSKPKMLPIYLIQTKPPTPIKLDELEIKLPLEHRIHSLYQPMIE